MIADQPVGPKLYLLDVEGTVAPLWLTAEVLFPYARAHFQSFLERSVAEIERNRDSLKDADFAEGSVLWDLELLALENRAEKAPDAPRIFPGEIAGGLAISNGIPRILDYVYWLMDRDRKSTALKSLQGKIWKAGFESGELKGTLFDEVPAALARWSQRARVAIYSSGSVEAQKLFFRYSSHGDMSGAISGYFDTRVGSKAESKSYAAIAEAARVEPSEILFFSDVVRELDAARAEGCATRLVVRPGNAIVSDASGHATVESFATF